GRSINMADAEAREIGCHCCSIVEAESSVELQAIGRARMGHAVDLAIAQRIVQGPNEPAGPIAPSTCSARPSEGGASIICADRLAVRTRRSEGPQCHCTCAALCPMEVCRPA